MVQIDGIFNYKVYGKSLFKPNLYWEDRNRDDIIVFNENLNSEEITKYLRVGSKIAQHTKDKTISTITNFWGYLRKEGEYHAIILYEFTIDIEH